MQSEIMNRLQVAMKYNEKENKTLLALVPVVRIRRDKSVQTGFLRTATFSRFQQLIQGPSVATLYRIFVQTFAMTDTEASTLLICIFRLTIPKLCKACIVYEESNVA